jgi:serine/threonine protein kinase
VSSRNQAKSNAEENCAGGWKQCVTWAIEAADALHCAHENGIVHRDIKPSNLIVDHAEKVWITDFGLARCQTNESQSNAPQNKKAQRDATLTRTGDLLGTIRYMSPEQASGHTELVDHRTDIYALAATVFELLTLQPAVEGESGPLLLQKITSQSPRTLRSVRSDLPRDLGVVLQKAMASSKDDRYFNAKQFADDLQAVIDDRPIVARPPSLSQRAFRYTRRHKRVFAASVAVATVAFLGAAISLITFAHKSQLALTSEIQAQRYFNQARATVDHLGADVATQLAAIPGAEHVRQDLLRDTLAYYEEFVLQASDDPKSLSDVARTHHRIGVLTSELHSPSQALRSFQQSANTYDQIATDSDADPVLQTQATENLNAWGLALIQSGKLAEAKTVLANAASRQQKLVDREPDSVSLAVQLALIENNAGLLALHQGAAEIAQQHFAVSINILRVQQKRAQTETQALPERAHRALAAALQNSSKGITKSDPAGAIILLEEAISMQLDLANRSSNRLRATQDMAVMYNNLASAHSEINNDEMAAQALQRAIALQRQLRLVAPNVSQYSSELALSLNNLAMIRQRQSNHAEAAELISQAITLHKSAGSSVGPANGSSPQEQVRLGAMLHNQALSKIANGDLPGAIDVLHAAIRCQKRVLQTQPSQPKANAFLSQHYTQLLKCQTRLKRWQDVETTAKEYSNTAKDSPKQLSELRNDLAAAGKTMPPDIRRRLPSLVASTEVAK